MDEVIFFQMRPNAFLPHRFTSGLVPAEMLERSLELGKELKFQTLCLFCSLALWLLGWVWNLGWLVGVGWFVVWRCLASLFGFRPSDGPKLPKSPGSSGGIPRAFLSVQWAGGNSFPSRARHQKCKAMALLTAPQALCCTILFEVLVLG